MPAVAGPHSPGVVALDDLPDDRFSPSALLNQEAGPWPLLLLFGLVRRQQAHPFTKKTLGEPGAVVVTAPQRRSRGQLDLAAQGSIHAHYAVVS